MAIIHTHLRERIAGHFIIDESIVAKASKEEIVQCLNRLRDVTTQEVVKNKFELLADRSTGTVIVSGFFSA